MLAFDRRIRLRAGFAEYVILGRWDATADEADRALEPDRALAELSWALGGTRFDAHERRSILLAIRNLLGDRFHRLPDDERLLSTTLEDLDRGRLLMVPVKRPEPPGQAASGPPVPDFTQGGAAPRTTHWFEVEVIDHLGTGVAGVELAFRLEDGEKRVTSDSAGVARLSGVSAAVARVEVADFAGLVRRLRPGWERAGDGAWVEGTSVSHCFELSPLVPPPVFTVEARSRATILLEPPYRVRVLDEGGRPVRARSVQVEVGGRSHSVALDEQGWIEFPVGRACPETATLRWHDGQCEKERLVRLACFEGDADAVAMARLENLGYPGDRASAVSAFVSDHGSGRVEPYQGGPLPAVVLEEIERVWMERQG